MNENIKSLIEQLTLEEKASLCSGLDFWHTKGIERLSIPSIMVTDGPHGLRKQAEGADHLGINDSLPATCFPSAAGLACSWDRELIQKVGMALGEEAQAEGVAILLGPGANIKRSPLCGRNFEYFSEDPYLSSEMASSHITGVQSKGIGASLKHFAVNNQEHRRMSVDAIVDERTLREIYLASFEGAIKQAKPWTVMSAYNKVNGTYASENETLLTNILREEWGYAGFVVSDWGALDERVNGLIAGLELEMPPTGELSDQKLIDAVINGEFSEDKLNISVERILKVIFKTVEHKKENAIYDQEKHHQLAREIASESMVLLKNEANILPLKGEGSIAIIGELAKNARYQGGGSSHINPTKLDDVFGEVEKVAGPNVNVIYAQGYHVDNDDTDQQLLEQAREVACQSEVAVLFLGLPDRYESEGYDREHLHIPENQRKLIEEIALVNSNIVVVLSNGAPIEMPWINNVKGLLEGYLGGQALGGAIADILFGHVNPSGKLAETFPKQLSDNPSYMFFPGEGDKVKYSEGLFVGYRYYDTKYVEPLFPFGYGLSYTNFEYSNLSLSHGNITDQDIVTVQVNVKNTGQVFGKEIVQVYVRDVESSIVRPAKELKGFNKVSLQAGEEKTVYFELDKRAFAYYDVDLKDWLVESGEFEIIIGKSSRDIVLKDTIRVTSTIKKQFMITRNTPIEDIMKNEQAAPILMEFFKKIGQGMGASVEDNNNQEMVEAMMRYMPLRAFISFSNGAFTDAMLEGLLSQLNEVVGNVIAQNE